MSIKDYDCYGEKKEKIIAEYFLTPLAYLKLVPGQKKIGCCGELKDKFSIFSYSRIQNKEDKGVFFVGYDCAKQMIDLINVKKQAASKPLFERPPLFDPMGKGFSSEPYQDILHVNRDALEIILLLASVWDVQRFKGTLPYLLSKIVRNPTVHLSQQDLIALNVVVGKDQMILNGEVRNFRERLQKEDRKFYCPTLLSIRAILDFLKLDDISKIVYI